VGNAHHEELDATRLERRSAVEETGRRKREICEHLGTPQRSGHLLTVPRTVGPL